VTGGVWIASYVMLWITVAVLGLTVVALLRQIGVLHARLRPLGVHFAGEGPERLAPAPIIPGVEYSASPLTLVAFTAPGCAVCEQLLPALRALRGQYRDVRVHELLNGPVTAPLFAEFRVRSTPYFVAVDPSGIVRGRGVANSLEQIELLIEEAVQLEPTVHDERDGANARG
jgi:thiol-disulfide isomerase/thioredoxin